MTSLETWLKQATCGLSAESTGRVRREIYEHYDSALDAAMSVGTQSDADRAAVASLGDAKAANREYRKVLLTASEAKMLGDAKWEARAVCGRPWLRSLMLGLPAMVLCGAALAFASNVTFAARLLLLPGIAGWLIFTAPFLPLYTPFRARIFRYVKWAGLIAAVVLSFGPNAFDWFGAITIVVVGVTWTEWVRSSIRRKLPVAEWPKALYL